MRTVLLLLSALLPVGGVPTQAAPVPQTPGPCVPGTLAQDRLRGMDDVLVKAERVTLRPAAARPTGDVPAAVPADIRARIAAIRPGMTRADLSPVFTAAGSLYSRLWQQYACRESLLFYREPKSASHAVPLCRDLLSSLRAVPLFPSPVLSGGGPSVMVAVKFAPRGAEVFWSGGRGVLVHPDQVRKYGIQERSDDIILSVSAPYLGYASGD
jgi:hypothetical protein